MGANFRSSCPFLLGCFLAACGSDPDGVVVGETGGGGPGEGGSAGAIEGGSSDGGDTGTGGLSLGGGRGTGGAPSGGGSGGATTVDPCDDIDCEVGQRCEPDSNDEGMCVDNECSDLDCADDEECRPVATGGNECVDIGCRSDLECPLSRYCSADEICVDDECESGTRECSGDEVLVCAANGSGAESPYQCSPLGDDRFQSICNADNPGATGCTCEDDWDCPPNTVCETGVCTGTGVEPTCTLPPTPFDQALPQLEFRWGGPNRQSPDAVDDMAAPKPFAWSSQVVSPPIVVNLDDDNGDGLVNELDFPEIVFLTHHTGNWDGNGVLRAVHGGGPAKGQDFFAACGDPSGAGARWVEGEAAIQDCDPGAGDAQSQSSALALSSGVPAAGDIDGDGFVEIVVAIEGGGFMLFDRQGQLLLRSPAGVFPSDSRSFEAPAPAIANLDFAGLAEIIFGDRVITLSKTADAFAIDRIFVGGEQRGLQSSNADTMGPAVCVADLTDDPGLEIVAGTTAYRMPESPDLGCGTVASPCPLAVVWNAAEVPGNALDAEQRDGFCAVADVLGAEPTDPPGPSNPLDGQPEVVLVAEGHLLILDGATGAVYLDDDLDGGPGGGAPNIDDFDGDGFPEIATALADFYAVIDLQEPTAACPAWVTPLDKRDDPPQSNPARAGGEACASDADCTEDGTVCNLADETCVCLHNGWKRQTEDDSSHDTSSSVFDFNGDGAAEVVYNDECYFRVYEGATGRVHLALPSLSRTIIENPVVADVDNDGNAEIVFVANNSQQQCNEGDNPPGGAWGPEDTLDSWPDGDGDVPKRDLPNGLEVWGDPSDVWVAARRVWNQHSYHVTNVTESGGVPLHEPESWLPLNGRLYNSYRSQPRVYGVAPDLTLAAIQVSSPDLMCGELSDEIEITVLIRNDGDLRVGPGVVVELYGIWEDGGEEALLDDNGDPITVTLDVSLEPGASTRVTVPYSVGNNAAPHDDELPITVRATIDGGDGAADGGMAHECIEDNNEIEGPVDPGEELPDIAIEIDDGNCSGDIDVTVTNNGSAAASDVLVRIYAGDPSSGGTLLAEETLPGPIEPGDSVSVTIDVGRLNRNITIWGVADPLDTILECNDANNVVEGPMLECEQIPA